MAASGVILLRVVAARSRAGGRVGEPSQKAPVVDADHVLGPLAGGEVRTLLETHELVVGVIGPDDEVGRLFFSDGEPPVNLRAGLLHS
jgi:hypothetical protein